MQLWRRKADHIDEFRQGLAPTFALAVGQHTVPTPASAGAGVKQPVTLHGTWALRRRRTHRRLRKSVVRCGRGEIRSSGDLPWPVFVNGPERTQRQSGNANMRLGARARHER